MALIFALDDHVCNIHPVYVFFYWDCTSVQNLRVIGQIVMEILNINEIEDTESVATNAVGAFT